jgi:cation transport ATPase
MRTQKYSLHRPSLAHHQQQRFRLETWQRWGVYTLVSGLTISGLVWLGTHFFLRQTSEFGAVVHPWEHPAMQVHGALAMLSCLLFGTLFQLHIRRAYRAQSNRASGWSMLIFVASLIVSGYALYYLVSEENHVIWSTLHWLIGLALPILLVLHIWLGRKPQSH